MEAARPYMLTQTASTQSTRTPTVPSQTTRTPFVPIQSTLTPTVPTNTPSSSTAQASPKKSPKKNIKFRQNSNNSSPKRSNEPSTSNRYYQSLTPIRSQYEPIRVPTRSPNEPSTSTTRFYEKPFPRKPNDNLVTAIENHLKPSPRTPQEPTSSVNPLIITVHNNTNPPQRIVQNDATRVDSDTNKPQFIFPQQRPFQYDQNQAQRKVCPPFPYNQARSGDQTEHVNGEKRPIWREYRDRQIRKHYEDDDFDYYKKVIVTGFPAYTKPEELVRKLSGLGTPQIEIIKNRVAVIIFSTEHEAHTALQANDTIAVYGTILSILKYTNRRHVMDLIRANKRVVKSEHKGPPVAAPTEIDLSGDFSQQMQNIEDAIRLTQEEVNNINLLFEDIEKYMRMIFPTCEAVPFGSITTGQGIKSSDADCFLSLAPGVNGRPGLGAAELCSQFVSRAARLLRLYPTVFSRLVAIPRANTPIIKFLHVPTNVNCDLNSKTPLGVQNSRLIGHLLRGHPRFGSVALLLKYWARVHQLSGTGRLTNYALLLLLIFYLQRTMLPPVFKLQDPEHSFIVENWEAGFNRDPLPFVREIPPLRDLLGGFFLYYAEFDFEELVVCPLVGRPLRKAEFDSNVLPPQYALYRWNILQGLALSVRTSSSICVQDPFELSHNVASSVSSRLAAEIKAHIKMAATAYSQDEKTPGDFLRTILLTRPPEIEGFDTKVPPRMSLPARLLLELDENWQETMRDMLLNVVFKDLMFVELTRRDSVSREPDVELEVYYSTLKQPIWKRREHNGRCNTPAAASAHLCRNAKEIALPFEVELSFRSKPRGLSITTNPLDGADEESFKQFRQFVHTFIHRWHKELLKPHLKQDPVRCEKPTNSRKSPKRSPKKRQNIENQQVKIKPGPTRSDPPIESVAFVNSNHKDLSESVAAISLVDSSNQNLKRDNDTT